MPMIVKLIKNETGDDGFPTLIKALVARNLLTDTGSTAFVPSIKGLLTGDTGDGGFLSNVSGLTKAGVALLLREETGDEGVLGSGCGLREVRGGGEREGRLGG